MILVLLGGIAAAGVALAQVGLLMGLVAAAIVLALSMRTKQARQRLGPLLLTVAGLAIVAAAADPGVRAWL